MKKCLEKIKKCLTNNTHHVIIEVSKKDTRKKVIKMNKARLESVMKLHGDTGKSLAMFLGMARPTFSAKINETNGAEFTQGEICKIKEKYGLTPKEVTDIFF